MNGHSARDADSCFLGKETVVPDATDLSMVVSSALPATFTFLYQRLSAVLSRHRAGQASEPEAAPETPAQLVGTLSLPLVADPERLDARLATLEALALGMAHYQRDPAHVTSSDQLLLQTLGRVREALEDVYGQRFTFEGEHRPPSGPLSEHHYDSVAGEVVAMEAEEAILGPATSRVRAKSVEPGGRVVGMKARVIDGRG